MRACTDISCRSRPVAPCCVACCTCPCTRYDLCKPNRPHQVHFTRSYLKYLNNSINILEPYNGNKWELLTSQLPSSNSPPPGLFCPACALDIIPRDALYTGIREKYRGINTNGIIYRRRVNTAVYRLAVLTVTLHFLQQQIQRTAAECKVQDIQHRLHTMNAVLL